MTGSGEDNIQTRLGVKLTSEGVSDADKGSNKLFGVYAEGQVNKKLNVWTNVGQQLGDNGYRETSVTLGIKYRF